MRTFQITLCGVMSWLMLAATGAGQDNPDIPLEVPPSPLPNSKVPPAPAGDVIPSLLPGQEAAVEALTEEELEQIFLPVDLNLKRADEFTISTVPEVYLDEDDPSRGFINPPPMQANTFDEVHDPASLHLFPGNGVEYPYYTPVAPFPYPPLYFEEPYLERYGDAYCCPVQSLVSGVKFYSRIALLPFEMLSRPPCEPAFNIWADPVDDARR